PDKSPLCCSCPCSFLILKIGQIRKIFSCSSLDCQDSLTCCRDDLRNGKIPADPLFQSQPLKSRCRQDQSAVFTVIQLSQSGNHISPYAFKRHIRKKFF